MCKRDMSVNTVTVCEMKCVAYEFPSGVCWIIMPKKEERRNLMRLEKEISVVAENLFVVVGCRIGWKNNQRTRKPTDIEIVRAISFYSSTGRGEIECM